MKKKLNVAVLCGGQSSEHEVSIESSKNVIQALDKQQYEILVILITKKGEWVLLDTPDTILKNATMQHLSVTPAGSRLAFNLGNNQPFLKLDENVPLHIDVVFPVLHGSHGEDGTLQGFLELINTPYVGTGTLGSAVCMDKEVTKHLLSEAGIPLAKWMVVRQEIDFEAVIEKLGLPFFVKPANTGSSVGISKVKNAEDFAQALMLAKKYDHKIILEEYIEGREIECAVLGNGAPEASLPGEIIPHHEFYSYEAKYLDPLGASLKTPAELSPQLIEKIQTLAKQAFSVLCCEGMARVDFFLTRDECIFLNEANTIPGFTQISMYPKLWAVSGLHYSALLDRLIQLALEKFHRNRILLANSEESGAPSDPPSPAAVPSKSLV